MACTIGILKAYVAYKIKEMICLQHFHNIFTTNPKWQIVTGCYCWGEKVILVLGLNNQ